MNVNKYNWSYSDDLTCCMLYLEFATSKAYNKSVDELIDRVENKLPQIKRGSIRMKLQNIKYLSDHLPEAKKHFPSGDRVPLSPLPAYSEQNKNAFLEALKKQFPSEPSVKPNVGDTVFHKTYGFGNIVKVEVNTISVKFDKDGTSKVFPVPDAFEHGFLQLLPQKPPTHGWTYEEEFTICRLYLDHRYGNLSALTQEELILLATVRIPELSAEDAKNGLAFVHGLMEREDEEIDEDDPDDELLLKKALGHALKDFVKTELKDKQY